MGLSRKLEFDPTDANTIAESDQVGSYLFGAGGTLITSTTVASDEALDVNLVQSVDLTVTATDLDIRDLDASQDSVEIKDAGGDALGINADGSLNVVATATDLDIRDLVNTQDSVAIGDETNLIDMQQFDAAFGASAFAFPIAGVRQDAAGSPVSADGDSHPLVFNDDGELKVAADLTSSVADDAADSGNPIKIGGRGVDGALTALSASNDRFDLIGDLYRRVYVATAPNVGNSYEAATVTTTAAELLATPLSGRQRVIVQNLGTRSIYLGFDGSVTTANGIRVPRGGNYELPFGEDLDLYAIAPAGSQDVRIQELA